LRAKGIFIGGDEGPVWERDVSRPLYWPKYSEEWEGYKKMNAEAEKGSYGGDDSMHFIADKEGPGAFCGRNSTSHRKCHEPKGGTEKGNIEACGVLGGIVGGFWVASLDGPSALREVTVVVRQPKKHVRRRRANENA
jgi:hypothetical protein